MAIAVPGRRRIPWRPSVRLVASERVLPLAGFAGLALASVYVGRAIAGGSMHHAAGLALLPAFVFVAWRLASGARKMLLYLALGVSLIPFTSIPATPLPGLGQIFLADAIVGLVIGTWLAERLAGGRDVSIPRTPILGWPLVIFGLALIPGILEGHDKYGAALLGQPVRFVFYAGIAGALARLTAAEAYRGIVVVFYAGTVLETLAALYYLGSGGSATDAYALSTGGTRLLALSTAMYLAGALVLALLNLQLDPARRLVHMAFAAMAVFGVIVAYGRTTYAAVAVLLPVLFVLLREMRRATALSLPFVAPVVVVAALLLPTVAPDLIPTFKERVTPEVRTDSAVLWRERAVNVTLSSTADQRVTGGGFGGTQVFTVSNQTYQISGDPHNSFIYLLAGGGIFALATFSLLLLLYLVDAVRRLLRSQGTDRALVAFSLSMFFIFVVNTITGPILTAPTLLLTFWCVLLLPALVDTKREPDVD